jgi:dipeptidyl aminopeptidase/acylaminoacyl peptidase
MKSKVFAAVLVILLLVIVVPFVLAQAFGGEERTLQGISLTQTVYEEISFVNEAQDIQLGGMLFLPHSDDPYPAVVIIHGSGTSRRKNQWYVTLAHALQESGIAVLLPDKRGSEKSGGNWRTASFEDLATDTVAAVDYLKERGDLPITRMGIVGLSQGGHFAPVAATLSPDIAFVVNLVGGAVTIEEQLLYEENHNLRQMGLLPGISNLVAYPAAWSIREVRQKEFWDAVGNFDPLSYWRAVDVPALVLYGEEDTNVPAVESAARLRGLNKGNIEVRIYEGSGHALEDPLGRGNDLIRAEVLAAVSAFILAVE